jgi:hypothetical protein
MGHDPDEGHSHPQATKSEAQEGSTASSAEKSEDQKVTVLGSEANVPEPQDGVHKDAVEEDKIEEESDDLGPPSGDLTVSPVVLTEKGLPRDIIKRELTLRNNTSRKLNLYAVVENIDPARGNQEFQQFIQADASTSLANWIEVSRGVIDLAAHEKRVIPFLIHVNLRATPGTYHAQIRFHAGRTRAEAQERPALGELLITLEVLDDAKEHLQLAKFLPEENLFFGGIARFSFEVENTGSEPLVGLRYFGPDVHKNLPKVGDYRKA